MGQRPEWGSTNPGAVAAVLGKDGAARFGRCGVEAGDNAAGESEGSDAKLVGLFRGATGAECLWSSLLILWNTSPRCEKQGKIYELFQRKWINITT